MNPWPALYIDVETSDYHDDQNPSLPVQVAVILATEHVVVATLACILSQRMWHGVRLNPIADRVISIHHIAPEMCDLFGWPPDVLINRLRQMVEAARVIVAHNIGFDLSVIDHMTGVQRVPNICWPEQFCTMRESAPIVKLPSRGKYSIGGYKAPKLNEAYHYFTKRDIINAHDALADVYACRHVHKGILRVRTSAVGLNAVE